MQEFQQIELGGFSFEVPTFFWMPDIYLHVEIPYSKYLGPIWYDRIERVKMDMELELKKFYMFGWLK